MPAPRLQVTYGSHVRRPLLSDRRWQRPSSRSCARTQRAGTVRPPLYRAAIQAFSSCNDGASVATSFPRAFRFGLSGTHALDGKSRSPWITSPLATSNSKLPLSGGDLPDVILYLPQRPLQNIIRKSGKHVRHDCATSHPKGRTQAVRVAENASSRLIGEPLRAGSVRCQVASFVVVSRAEFRTTRQCPGLLGFTPLPRRCRCLRR